MQQTYRIVKSFVRHPIQFLRAKRLPPGFWLSPENLVEEWDERTAKLAAWIPDGSSVIEFGAGNQALRGILGANCTYQPADLCKRSEDTLVFDLNEDLPDLPRDYDFAVFSGVLEYVNDIPRLIAWLRPRVSFLACSYVTTDMLWDPITRKIHGWNDYSAAEFQALLGGFTLRQQSSWKEQSLFLFERID